MLRNPLPTTNLEMRLGDGFRRYENSLQIKQRPRRPLPMVKPTRRSNRRRHALTLPELEHSKAAVLNSLGSLQSRRSYKYAIEEFICWYCSEPGLAVNRAVVLRYRLHLEGIPLAPSTINVRLAAIRRIAYEAADTGLLSPELVAGIRRVKGMKRLGQPVGNWLTAQQARQLLSSERRASRPCATG